MFIDDSDYRVVCDAQDLDILTQSDPVIRVKAEGVAMEEVASYLRGRYDTDKAFAATGEERNMMLLQVVANVAMYYMAHWLPQSLALDARFTLYEKAIDWLNRVAKGSIMPDLPTYTGGDGSTDITNPVRYGSLPRTNNDY
ncbi:MAG: phage protein Gp36 family protein [Bacteroidales bacterium]